jgi:flagellar hook-basal body protein
VTAQGHFVLDADGNKIELPANGSALSVNGNGVLQTTEGAAVTLGLTKFPNPEGLAPQGETCYSATVASGQPEPDADSTIVQGGLENSNVDLAQELTLLIRAQRAYSLASRALTTSDDMLGLANNMR